MPIEFAPVQTLKWEDLDEENIRQNFGCVSVISSSPLYLNPIVNIDDLHIYPDP